MRLKTIAVKIEDQVATVSLNRPEVRNAFQPEMIEELKEVFLRLPENDSLSAIILSGEGKSFSAGADLGYMKSMVGFTKEENETDARHLHEMFWTMRTCPLPLLGRLHGHVMGGGLGLAAVCDVVVSLADTVFCFSEAKLGLVPAVISPFVMEKMNPSHAKKWMLVAETFDAKQALEAGLVDFIGDEGAVETFVECTLKSWAACAPQALRATKRLLRDLGETPQWERRRDLTTQVIAERRVSAEGQEGLISFLEKRQPRWRVRQ